MSPHITPHMPPQMPDTGPEPRSLSAAAVSPPADPTPAGLACPDCGAALASAEGCAACGRSFPLRSGRREIMPGGPRSMAVGYDPQTPLVPPPGVMRFPPRTGPLPGGVHHLDIAHAEALQALPAGARVLEIGCGGGQMRDWARAQGLDYVGIDVADDRVHDWLRAAGGPDLFADAHALPFADASFDAVYAVAVWEHLALPAMATAQAARVLRPGGVMLGTVSMLEPWHDASHFHMTPSGVFRTLVQAGLAPRLIWPGVGWSGFRAILSMGNKATRLVRWAGGLAHGWYLAPKAVQAALRLRRWPRPDDLYQPLAEVAGAIAWIADKPAAPPAGTSTGTSDGTPTGVPTDTSTGTPAGSPTRTPTGDPTGTPTGTPAASAAAPRTAPQGN